MKYNHMVAVAFSVISNDPDGLDVTPAMFRDALFARIGELTEQEGLGAWEQACLPPDDTYEVDDD